MGAVSAIEQRWSQRRSVSLGVDIVENKNLLLHSKARDVSLGGVFLETETDTSTVEMNKDVELVFILNKTGTTQHKLKARIVRVATDGVGLIFINFDTNSFRALQEIMRYSLAASE